MCPTASSGVPSILLKGGDDALHSKMKVLFKMEEGKLCNIKCQNKLSRELCKVDLLIWDEAPMFEKNILECIE